MKEIRIMAQNKLVGTWKLESVQYEFADTGEFADMYGAKPLGYLMITQDRRMMTIITSDGRAPPNGDRDEVALFKSMMAYTGKFRLEGDKFITKAEVSWHPAWVGTEQARIFTVEGDKLSIVTTQVAHPMFPGRMGRGVVKWHRADT
jgi:hypothetical protein